MYWEKIGERIRASIALTFLALIGAALSFLVTKAFELPYDPNTIIYIFIAFAIFAILSFIALVLLDYPPQKKKVRKPPEEYTPVKTSENKVMNLFVLVISIVALIISVWSLLLAQKVDMDISQIKTNVSDIKNDTAVIRECVSMHMEFGWWMFLLIVIIVAMIFVAGLFFYRSHPTTSKKRKEK